MSTTKAERALNIRTLMDKQIEDFLASYTVTDVKKEIRESMAKATRSSILKKMGIDVSWNDLRINSDSPLAAKMKKAADDLLDIIEFEKPVLTEKELDNIQKAYRKTYVERMTTMAGKLAEIQAKKDLTEVLGVFENED
jgi:hypothetical protein